MLRKIFTQICLLTAISLMSGCRQNAFQTAAIAPSAMRDVPALRLNFRYEADVPEPPADPKNAAVEERNALVSGNFDQSRPEELLDRTVTSPDKQKILAIYHRSQDAPSEFRLDMYAASGNLQHKITPDSMAVHFPEAIVWSPDSTNVAFVAVTRAGGGQLPTTTPAPPAPTPGDANAANGENNQAENNTNAEVNANSAAPSATSAPTPAAPAGVLTFRTEQIYICDADGGGIKPLTQTEGLIYFYFVWSPDGSMLAALAATNREWQYLSNQADLKGEVFVPFGRPRLIEKTGRERRLDDGLTQVHPVWSPDSAKVALGFENIQTHDKQIRIYDAIGNAPTQAAIPLTNQLKLSSQIYDRDLTQKMQNANTDANAPAVNLPANQNQAQTATTLPEESMLVSFNPIVNLVWTADEMLYFQTGYIKSLKNETDSVRSYLRWHRLILSPQPMSVK